MKLTVYTDGSCWPNPGPGGGYAAVILVGDDVMVVVFGRVEAALPDVTNNEMELRAILEALRVIPEASPEHEIIVRSDSEWSLRVLSGRYRATANTTLIRECWKHMRRLGARWGFLRMEHVRGHRGELHNELADEIAGGGATSIPTSPWCGRRVHVVSRGNPESADLGAACPEGLVVESWTSLTAKERARLTFLD